MVENFDGETPHSLQVDIFRERLTLRPPSRPIPPPETQTASDRRAPDHHAGCAASSATCADPPEATKRSGVNHAITAVPIWTPAEMAITGQN
jgi:hypothetical protein